MPERKGREKAPAGRVYKSAQPLRQAKLPSIRTRVKGYGSSSVRKIPSLQKQDTLTQMDFVQMADQEHFNDSNDNEIEDEEEVGVVLMSTGEVPLQEQNEPEVAVGRNLRSKTASSTSPQKQYRDSRTSPSLKNDLILKPEPKSVSKGNKRRRTLNDLPFESEEDEYQDSRKKRAKNIKKAGSSRRKTTGDQSSTTKKKLPGPQYHTQTITQLEWGVHSSRDELEAEDELEVGDGDIFDVPNSSQILNATRRRGRIQSPELGVHTPILEHDGGLRVFNSTQPDLDVPSSPAMLPPRRSTRVSSASISLQRMPMKLADAVNDTMDPPHTPKRVRRQEIPSSESPATPQFLKSGGSHNRLPLKQVVANTPVPCDLSGYYQKTPKLVIEDTFDTSTDVSQVYSLLRQSSDVPYESPRLPKMVIEDTFEGGMDISQARKFPSTPSKKSSPPKSVRFALPEVEPSSRTVEKTQKSVTFAKSIVLDSDGDDEDYEEYSQAGESQDIQDIQEAAPEPDTCYGDLGDDTQNEVDQLICTATSNLHTTSQAATQQVDPKMGKARKAAPKLTQPTQLFGPSMEGTLSEDANDHDDHNQDRTQFRASQRLHTQHLQNFAPRTLESDIFVPIASAQMTDIVGRKRTHDIRAYAYPPATSRIWFYVAKPLCKLIYMAVVGPAKKPGEIDETDEGTGIKAFNKKGAIWRAYEIEELYELADPLTMEQLKEHEWLQAPPKKFERVRPVVISILIANLMPPIFSKHGYTQDSMDADKEASQVEEESMNHTIPSSHNDTQDATDQLLSTMKQFTQFGTPTQSPQSSQAETHKTLERIPSSQDEAMLPPAFSRSAVKPMVLSQATTVDLTQTQHYTQVTTPRKPKSEPQEDIIWESPLRPVHSTPTQLPGQHRSDEGVMLGGDSFVVPMSIPSSQMLTRSQMEDEIVFDSIPPPPMEYLYSEVNDDEIEDDI